MWSPFCSLAEASSKLILEKYKDIRSRGREIPLYLSLSLYLPA